MTSIKKFQPNDVLQNRYKIERNHREGGMGCVDIAWDMQRAQHVAIKYATTIGNAEKDKLTNEKIQVESEILRDCDHPNIARYVDSFTYLGINVLVLGFIDGVTLDSLLVEGPLPEHQIVHISKEIILAIAHLSQRGIIYRDLKPSNVMVKKSDNHIVLIDFGTAKKGDLEGPKVKVEGTVIFSWGYEALEQLMGSADYRTDICAVGLTMYYMAMAKNPPIATSRPIPLIPDPSLKISRRIIDVINKATQKNPEDRYQNAMDMFYALSGQEPIQPAPRPVPVVPPPAGTPRLVFKKVAGTVIPEKIFPLTKSAAIIGREEPGFSPRPDIAVNDNQVSLKGDGRRFGHAIIFRDVAGCYWIEDLSSSNGTYVNSREVRTPVSLRNGDVISLGLRTIFEFRTD